MHSPHGQLVALGIKALIGLDVESAHARVITHGGGGSAVADRLQRVPAEPRPVYRDAHPSSRRHSYVQFEVFFPSLLFQARHISSVSGGAPLPRYKGSDRKYVFGSNSVARCAGSFPANLS